MRPGLQDLDPVVAGEAVKCGVRGRGEACGEPGGMGLDAF